MKKIRLCGIAEEQDQLIRELQLLGSVEIGSPEALTEAQQTQLFRTADGGGADALSQTSAALASALETLKHYETKKGGMFSARPEKTLGELFDDDAYRAAVQTAQEALDTQDARSRNQAEKSRLTALRESFVPWRTLDLPLETGGTQHARVLLGTVPAQTELDALRETVYGAAGEAQVERISADQQSLYLLVIVHKSAYDAAASALREYGFTQTGFDGAAGTAEENIRLTDEKLAACEQEDKRLTDKLTALAGDVPAIRLAADRCTQEISKAQAADRLAHSERTFCLDGWVPCEDVPKLEALLEKFCCAWELEDPSPEEYPDVPVKLKNNKLTWPLNMVTEMYSLPAYDGIDPNPLMFFWYIFFFGFMFADVAYGIIIYLACTLIQKKVRPKNTLGYMMSLGRWLGGSITFCGIFSGGFFGNSITTFAETFLGITQDQFPAWLSTFCDGIVVNPVEDPLKVLIIAICIGCVHLVFGQCIRIYMGFRDHEPLEGILDVVPWWIVFAGIAVLVFCDTPLVLILGALSLILTQGRHKEGGIIKKLMGGITSLYDITSWLSDVLSYARLMALMLAGSVIGMVFNTIAALPGNIIVFFVVFLIGHTFNIGVNLIGTYVHDARLQYLEFFGKFYKEGGIPFKPLKYNTKYVDIIEEEK